MRLHRSLRTIGATVLLSVLTIDLRAYEPIVAEKNQLLFADDFSSSELGRDWTCHPNSFFVEHGYLRATQLPDAGHGAVARAVVDFKDIWISFDFMFEGAERFNFVVDDKYDTTVHAGHICRFSLNKSRLVVQDDKTGTMNLEIRKRRLVGDSSPELEALLDSKRAAAEIEFKDGQWYHVDVLIVGDRMEVHLDGKLLIGHQSSGFAHATKTQFGFTVTGQSFIYDNLEAWSVR